MEKLLKLCRNESGDANVLLSAVNSINLNISNMDESQKQIPMEIEVIGTRRIFNNLM